MKLRYKILLGTGLVWIAFFVIAIFLDDVTAHIGSFVALNLLFFVFTFLIIHHLILRRVERLNQNIFQDRFSQPIKIDGNDELSEIATQINQIMNTLHIAEEKLERHPKEFAKPLDDDSIISSNHLNKLAHYDHLTSFPNRVFFNEMLNKTLNHANRQHKILALLLVDLDKFKDINSALGSRVGDEVLKQIAKRMTDVLPNNQVLARLGGDEFVILLNDVDHASIVTIVNAILKACAEPVRVNGRDFFTSASIGACTFPRDGISLEELQKNSDIALHKAKINGGNTCIYYDEKMSFKNKKDSHFEEALQQALSKNEFVLHYQPKLNLANGTITGVEALIRWHNPKYGIVDPDSFIPLTEKNNLIQSIGEWALREACRANKSWQIQGYKPISVSVNISPKQFNHHDISGLIAKILKETDLAPQYLELEITETTVMDNVESAAKKLNEIKRMGVKISIDDFGTGYTSINYLKQFPINILKIDRSFVKGLPLGINDSAITNAIIALGHSLGMEIVAEGVETAEQLQYLADHHCDLVQGYYFSRPMSEVKMLLQLGRNSAAADLQPQR